VQDKMVLMRIKIEVDKGIEDKGGIINIGAYNIQSGRAGNLECAL
jgi:hypothetical protein